MAKVGINSNKPIAYFYVSKQKEIEILLAIFSKYNLNTTKHLDFINFSKAFYLYIQNKNKENRKHINSELKKIILSMNRKRLNFNLPFTHKINITSN